MSTHEPVQVLFAENDLYEIPPPSHQSSDRNGSLSLQELVREIHRVLGPDGGLDSEHIHAPDILQLMGRYDASCGDWARYTLFDESRPYTRNLIDDGNGKFNLMILAWTKGQKSPIHNHSGSHCIMKILDGELEETLYDWPDEVVMDHTETAHHHPITKSVRTPSTSSCSSMPSGKPLTSTRITCLGPNQTTYVHDTIGLHRISNRSECLGAVSLHLYTPPYQVCKTFDENTSRARGSGVCTFYSVGGTRTEE